MKNKKGKKPTKKWPQPRRGGEEKRIRNKIEEALLAERLGLNDDWIDRWEEEDGQCKEESFAPEELPEFIRARFEEQVKSDRKATSRHMREQIKSGVNGYVNSVISAIEELVAVGCRKQVIYFCLNELSPESERGRFPSNSTERSKRSNSAGSPIVSMLEGEVDIPLRSPTKKLAQQQDFEELPVLARRVKRLIHRYRNELLLVTQAIERGNGWQAARRRALAAQERQNPPAAEPDFGKGIDLPSSWLTTPAFAEDALPLLESSLLWVAKLAKSYTAPFEMKVLKSKGFIFLTAYVDKYADLSKFRRKAHIGRENPVSVLTSLVGGKYWPPSYLKTKLQKFRNDHPDLYELLMDKLEELHRFHSPA